MIQLIEPLDGALVSIHTEIQQKFILDEEGRANTPGELAFLWYDPSLSRMEDSKPPKTQFCWKADEEGILEIARDPLFSKPDFRICGKDTAYADNFYLDTVYYWRVKTENETSEVRTFRTDAMAPRLLNADGISNVRDLGGWKTSDGKRIRQGLIFRSSIMDAHLRLTEEGKRTMSEQIGLKYELDLRIDVYTEGEPPASILADKGVKRIVLPISPYEEIHTSAQTQEMLCRIFSVFADKSYYPLCFHCVGGADRGGTLAFLLEAILGVSLSDMYLDYEMTTLSVCDIRTRNYQSVIDMIAGFDRYGDENTGIGEKVKRYLLTIGVTEEQIAAIRENLLEPMA